MSFSSAFALGLLAVGASALPSAVSPIASNSTSTSSSSSETPTAEPPGCKSYGVDFQSDGTYFQNASDISPFTFVQIFENCKTDTSSNILITPDGDEYFCTDTPLFPDDTNQLSTCPINKPDMESGSWSILILSNNGDGDPIAYQRDFFLNVGFPVTSTVTPTITEVFTSTPLANVSSTSTSISKITTTLSITKPSKTAKPTTTLTPQAVTSSTTQTAGTVTTTPVVSSPVFTTKTIRETCAYSVQPWVDPFLTWLPLYLPNHVSSSAALAISTQASSAGTAVSTAGLARRVPIDQAQRIAERKARMAASPALARRTPDVQTVILTALDTAAYPTVTSTSIAPTSTVYVTAIVTAYTTLTSTSTILSGTTTLPQVTIYAPTPTKTSIITTIITSVAPTITTRPTLTVSSTTVNPFVAFLCSIKGGRMQV